MCLRDSLRCVQNSFRGVQLKIDDNQMLADSNNTSILDSVFFAPRYFDSIRCVLDSLLLRIITANAFGTY